MDYKEFYISKGINLDNVKTMLFEKQRIPIHITEMAAKTVFRKVKEGDLIKDISLVHRIAAEGKPYRRGASSTSINKMKVQLMYAERRLTKLERPWTKKLKTYLKSDWMLFKERHHWLFERVEI
jgi:hypothetical protein